MADSSASNSTIELVALVASAGGLEAIKRVCAALPADFPAAVVIVQHLDPTHRSLMAQILGRWVALPVKQAQAGDRPAPGHIYIAPPDHHLCIAPDGRLSLSVADPVNYSRPSADVLLISVAERCGPRCVAIILTGNGHDGAQGIAAVRAAGGTTIAQDPATAEYPGMPRAAIATGCIDRVLPLDRIAPALVELIHPGAVR
jgi:two-component system chemotaxis response regulator CheB